LTLVHVEEFPLVAVQVGKTVLVHPAVVLRVVIDRSSQLFGFGYQLLQAAVNPKKNTPKA
jgi:hypothetical protein